MDELTPAQQIDTVLKLLQYDRGYTTKEQLLNRIRSKEIEIEGDILDRILEKLSFDRYVFITLTPGGEPAYAISYEGYLFHGYAKQQAIETEKEVIIARNESRRLRNDHRLIVGTWFAGFAALLLFLWQCWIWIYPLYKDYQHDILPKKAVEKNK
jgi:hypothetical protein